jgi:hypothetical protein
MGTHRTETAIGALPCDLRAAFDRRSPAHITVVTAQLGRDLSPRLKGDSHRNQCNTKESFWYTFIVPISANVFNRGAGESRSGFCYGWPKMLQAQRARQGNCTGQQTSQDSG